MNLRTVASLTGLLISLVAAILLAPLGLALVEDSPRTVLAYAITFVSTAAAAGLLRVFGRQGSQDLHRKDALGVVALTWLCLGVFGSMPFLIEGSIPEPTAALFEAVSGFTTTGATVVADVDGLSRATNLWRCEMHWIGGMGIVVLFVAIFPQLGVGAKHLFRSEVAGPITEGLRPHIKQTALALWWIYAGLTLVVTTLLVYAGMPVYDAICNGMSTIGTAGFSVRTDSIGAYNSPLVEWIVIVFMFVAGVNFSLYYGLLRGRWRDLWRNEELRFYLAVNLAVIAIIALMIWPRHATGLDAMRHSAFQTLAVTTTTGFMTGDFDAYPAGARMLLFLCMFMGGCAGSTSGGLKAIRVLVLLKAARRELQQLVQPNRIHTVRIGGTGIPSTLVSGILIFVATSLLIFAVSSFLLAAMGLDLVSAMSASIACLSGVGPGLGLVGPTQNYAVVPPLGKLMLSGCMIAGRLEIFALFAVFTRECWRK